MTNNEREQVLRVAHSLLGSAHTLLYHADCQSGMRAVGATMDPLYERIKNLSAANESTAPRDAAKEQDPERFEQQ